MATKTTNAKAQAEAKTLADRFAARLAVPAAASATITKVGDKLFLIFPARSGLPREQYIVEGDALNFDEPKKAE